MIRKELFGTLPDGREVNRYKISDKAYTLYVLDYGATIQKLLIPDKFGNLVDVVLGYDTIEEYLKNDGYLGATIGRVCNRIGSSKFSLEGKDYTLFNNNDENHLHGGKNGFDKKMFTANIVGEVLELKYISEHLEEGYPGKLEVTVKFSISLGQLKIDYYAETDKMTPISLTNHSYFNLNGNQNGDVLNHTLAIFADQITPTDSKLITQGDFLDVKGTAFDFMIPKQIGKDIEEKHELLSYGKGYDMNYIINGAGYRKFGFAVGDKSGIVMDCYTDMPCVQLYTGNSLNTQGKGGDYKKHSGFCLETQYHPNAVNFPSQYSFKPLLAGEVFHTVTIHKFFIK